MAPQYLTGIGSRTRQGYQTPRMFKFCSLSFMSVISLSANSTSLKWITVQGSQGYWGPAVFAASPHSPSFSYSYSSISQKFTWLNKGNCEGKGYFVLSRFEEILRNQNENLQVDGFLELYMPTYILASSYPALYTMSSWGPDLNHTSVPDNIGPRKANHFCPNPSLSL